MHKPVIILNQEILLKFIDPYNYSEKGVAALVGILSGADPQAMPDGIIDYCSEMLDVVEDSTTLDALEVILRHFQEWPENCSMVELVQRDIPAATPDLIRRTWITAQIDVLESR